MMEEVHELDKMTNGHEHIPIVQLKKTIGLASSVTLIVGSMIGSGIFVSPTGIMENVRSIGASLIIWVACGLFSMLGAYCYAELGTMIHRSGGDYIYVYEAFGPFLGFLRLWSEVVVARPASVAIMSITFAKYIAQPIFPDCDQPEIAIRLLAAVCIVLLSFINAYSVRLSTFVQDIFTYAKVAALVMIIITGFVQIGFGKVDGLIGAFDNSDWSPSALTRGFYVGLFAYSGWNYLNCMIEEMNNPRRDLPLAIIISCLLVTFIYTMANVAYTFSVRIYGVMWWIMPIFVALSTFGGVNGTVMTTSRMYFVASQVNQMPKLMCFLHVNRLTPISAVVFTCITSLIYLLVGDIYSLITYLGFVQWLAIGACVFIVIVFRITRRNHPRPVKAPILFPIIYVLITLFLVIFAFIAAPTESFYIIGCVWKNKPKSFQRKFGKYLCCSV
ncbi:Large neutral amino acids transporter small subunit 2 [Schistosoma japonicum]|nr:Large neutral amino acids transporter small subunit 2 [Schistosoma japonicum]